MIDLKAETQKFVAELRSTPWVRAALLATAVGVIAIGGWIGIHHFFGHKENPEYVQFSARAPDGVAMADVFLSYESITEVIAKLDYDHLSPERSSSHKPPSKRYPPRDLD